MWQVGAVDGHGSATWLSTPGNHWLYSRILLFINCAMWFLATSILMLACRLLESSLTLVVCAHLSEVVLSIIEREQSPFPNRPTRMSIYGDIMLVRAQADYLMLVIVDDRQGRSAMHVHHGYNPPSLPGMNLRG